ncbi:MAG: hypothetical protein ABIG42_01515 [bacterium]
MRNSIGRLTIPGLITLFLFSGCMGAAPDKLVEKFMKKCQTGNWSGAESMLSNTGKMHFKNKSLEDTYWPILGFAVKTGIPIETIKEKYDSGIVVISVDQSSSTRCDVRLKINNSLFIGADNAKSIAAKVGLEKLDITVKLVLVQESNRWKIELIAPQYSDQEKVKWANLASKSPESLGLL